MNNSFQKHLMTAIGAALAAGDAILEVYKKPDFKQEIKADNSPVTEADYAAHSIISDHLKTSGFPVLSEEGREIKYEERKQWRTFWLVDPLDGTKEFISRNGEFTVNIALVDGEKAVLGVLFAPLSDMMYFSDTTTGAFRIESLTEKWHGFRSLEDLLGASTALPLSKDDRPFRVVVSRSHLNSETDQYIKELEKSYPGLERVKKGSALKLCLVAEGFADIYPRFAPTWEWDTAAGQAIAESSGCRVTLHDQDSPLIYNKEKLLNPWFIVRRP